MGEIWEDCIDLVLVLWELEVEFVFLNLFNFCFGIFLGE